MDKRLMTLALVMVVMATVYITETQAATACARYYGKKRIDTNCDAYVYYCRNYCPGYAHYYYKLSGYYYYRTPQCCKPTSTRQRRVQCHCTGCGTPYRYVTVTEAVTCGCRSCYEARIII